MGILKHRKSCTKPISVSYAMDVPSGAEHRVRESRVIVVVSGNCVGRPMLLAGAIHCPPKACGGYVFESKYMYDADRSVIEYRFRDGLLKNRERASERFRNKMLKQIERQQSR